MNTATITVIVIIILIVLAAVVFTIRNRMNRRGGCLSGCDNCPQKCSDRIEHGNGS